VTRVAVVGAGWSGLACALALSARGCAVELFDAAPQVGGRARSVRVPLGDRSYLLDNGQHLLIGGYRDTLRLMRQVGVDLDAALLRLPFELRYADGVLLRARPLPAPLDLAAAIATADGLSWADRLQAISFAWRWRRRGWRVATDLPASALFAGAPLAIVRRLWRPLCLAALNVELHEASAQVLLAVLRDSLAGGSGAADLLLPRVDLSRAFAEPAAAALAAGGARLHLHAPVQQLRRLGAGWQLDSRGQLHAADAVVLALPPARAMQLLATVESPALTAALAQLRGIAMAPIATVYLRYPPGTRLEHVAYALLDDAAAGRHGQWLFDRGRLDEANDAVMSVVISAAAAASAAGAAALAASVAAQLSGDLGLPAPLASAAIVEKRATLVPAPGLARPAARLPLPGLFIAGDAAASEYPSTLEGSVRSGLAAAAAAG